MNDKSAHNTRLWRPITCAVLTAVAAAVTTFACLSGPSSAAPSSNSPAVSGVNARVPAGTQGALGGDIGTLWYQQH